MYKTKTPLRFHIHGTHHTQTRAFYNSDAFCMQILHMCDVLTKMGHTVFHYGNAGSNPNCTENVIVSDKREFVEAYPEGHYRHQQFSHQNTGIDAAPQFCAKWDERVIDEIHQRFQSGDFILNISGTEYNQISNSFEPRGAILVEPGVGYWHTNTNTHRIFVSYGWQGYHYGNGRPQAGGQAMGAQDFPNWQDAVIHYFVDEEQFEYSEDKEDYAFFIARFNSDKGPMVAIETVERYRKETGHDLKLKMAGSGHEWLEISEEQKEWCEMLGYIEPDEKTELMKKAKVLFAPTLYFEPFGAIVAEANLSGTPVITSDWGGFAESVLHGVTGYRCRTHEQFVWALKNIDKIKAKDCRNWALNNFTKKSQGPKYDEYFTSLHRMKTSSDGWYQLHNDREELEWLKIRLP